MVYVLLPYTFPAQCFTVLLYMQDWDPAQLLGKLAVTSEYFLQVTIDKAGKVLSSNLKIPTTSLLDSTEKPLRFEDCFLSSDWSTYENQRIEAWKSSQRSFMVELQKIIYPEKTTVLTKWEFFFDTEDPHTCFGLGHPLGQLHSYNFGLDKSTDGSADYDEVLDILLENKLLGFWEFDPENRSEYMSNGLAQILGYSADDLINSKDISWQNHIHPEDYGGILKMLTQHFSSAGSLSFRKEFRIITKNEQTAWVMGFGRTTKWTDEGKPGKIQGVIIDISERKKREMWMKEHQNFLEDLSFQQSHSLRARVANIRGILKLLDTEKQSLETKNLLEILKKESKLLDQSLKESIRKSVIQNKEWSKGINTELL